MLDVPDVPLDAALHLPEGLGLAAEARYLAVAGDPGADIVADHIFVDEFGVFLGMLEHVGPRAHDAHVAEQHVDELRQLVDIGLAHDVAPLGLAGVVFGGLQGVGLVVDLHTAEFDAGELLAVEPVALLTEEHRPGHREFGDYCHNDQDGNEKGAEEEQREHNVECPLDHSVLYPAERLLVEAQAGHAAHHVEVHLARNIVAHIGHAVEPHHMVLAVADYRKNHFLLP